MRFLGMAGAIVALATAPAQAQAVKSVVTASNGVEVTVYADEFAGRYEYTAPTIKLDDGFVFVATIKKGGVAPAPHLTGTMSYVGEWRRYQSALYRGGDAAKFIEAGREVGRCYSSRYSRGSCSLMESFKIEVGPNEIAKHAQAGVLAIQIRAQDTSTTIINVPTSYFDAVKEVSNK